MLHRFISVSFRRIGLSCCVICALYTIHELKAESSAPFVDMTIETSKPLSVTGEDDVARLKALASGIGWEFSLNADVVDALKHLRMKWIRCINVDPLPGHFTDSGGFVVGEPKRLLAHLETCRAIGASPHIIIGQGLHPALRLSEADLSDAERGLMGNQASKVTFGPTDWGKFRAYCRAYFQYVLIEQKFPAAVFEVGNEPDIGGTICPRPPKPANGSAALYDAYFNWYKNIAQAAREFEAMNPGQKVTLGGPALAWAYTFRYGSFNWGDRFVRDCAEQKIKLDFIGVHYYGNASSIDGSYEAPYPSFHAMYQQMATLRDKVLPGVPIAITEWGPSYHTNNKPESLTNGDNIGAAWSAAFLNQMLEERVDKALYLVATDLAQYSADKKLENVWGWPSLFVHPGVYGKAYPKAPYYLFDFVQKMEGHRVRVNLTEKNVHAIASVTADGQRVTALVWNARLQLPENKAPMDASAPVELRLNLAGAAPASWRQVTLETQQINENSGNVIAGYKRGVIVTADDAALRDQTFQTIKIEKGVIQITTKLAPASVSFVQITHVSQ